MIIPGEISSRDETRSADGVVKGSYTYIDANSVPQTIKYVADENGFQIEGSNIPKHVSDPNPDLEPAEGGDTVNPHVPYTEEVAEARARHFNALKEASERAPREKRSPKPFFLLKKLLLKKKAHKTKAYYKGYSHGYYNGRYHGNNHYHYHNGYGYNRKGSYGKNKGCQYCG